VIDAADVDVAAVAEGDGFVRGLLLCLSSLSSFVVSGFAVSLVSFSSLRFRVFVCSCVCSALLCSDYYERENEMNLM